MTATRLVAHIAMTAGKKTAGVRRTVSSSWAESSNPVTIRPGRRTRRARDPGLGDRRSRGRPAGPAPEGHGVTTNDVSVVTQCLRRPSRSAGDRHRRSTCRGQGHCHHGHQADRLDSPERGGPRAGRCVRSPGRPWACPRPSAPLCARRSMPAGGDHRRRRGRHDPVVRRRTKRLCCCAIFRPRCVGLSGYNIANTLAGAGPRARLPCGRRWSGLAHLHPDEGPQPRPDEYLLTADSWWRASVILDLAHNEAGLEALPRRRPRPTRQAGASCSRWGRRGPPDEILLRPWARSPDKRADVVVIAHRTNTFVIAPRPTSRRTSASDWHAPDAAASRRCQRTRRPRGAFAACRDGDVIAIMTHERRLACVDWFAQPGCNPRPARRIFVAKSRWRKETRPRRQLRGVGEHRPGRAHRDMSTHTVDRETRVAAGAPSTPATDHRRDRTVWKRPWPPDSKSEPNATVPASNSLQPVASRAAPTRATPLLAELASERPESAAVIASGALAALEVGRAQVAVVADLVRPPRPRDRR